MIPVFCTRTLVNAIIFVVNLSLTYVFVLIFLSFGENVRGDLDILQIHVVEIEIVYI